RSRTGSDAERARKTRRRAYDAEHARDAVKGREVDGRVREARRGEEAALELDEGRHRAPVEQRQGQPSGPRDHEGVAFEQLAETSLDGHGTCLAAGGAAARRVADGAPADAGIPEED